jgi:hypothetical protein
MKERSDKELDIAVAYQPIETHQAVVQEQQEEFIVSCRRGPVNHYSRIFGNHILLGELFTM